MYLEVPSRQLRNETGALLRRVEAGATVVITRRGRPVADLVPHRGEGQRWFSPDEVIDLVESRAADPGLRADLEGTADELGPIR